MPKAQDVFWFKSQFQPAIDKAIAGTPFSVDMIRLNALATGIPPGEPVAARPAAAD